LALRTVNPFLRKRAWGFKSLLAHVLCPQQRERRVAIKLLLLVIVLLAILLGFVAIIRANRQSRLDTKTLEDIEQIAHNYKLVSGEDSLMADQILSTIYKNRQTEK
jgi:hypothetical protein